MKTAPSPRDRFPGVFFAVNYLALLAILIYIAGDTLTGPPTAVVFLAGALIGYVALYLTPAILATALFHRFVNAGLARAVAVLLTTGIVLIFIVDAQVHQLYGFHLNGFVWNLLVTPGGIASMGGSDSAFLVAVLIGLSVLFFEAGIMWLGRHPLPALRWVLVVLLVGMIGERVAYGISDLQGYRPVLAAAQSVPFYQPATFSGLAERFGYQRPRRGDFKLEDGGRLNYPARPLEFAKDPASPNILFLVSESLRADMLTPEIMPNLWAFAADNGRRYTQHVSGGNGTRMGVFSLFYGLPGNYWFSFLNHRRPPVLVTELQRRGYRLGLYTSARFSYPEFDQTVFASVPEAQLHSDDEGLGWQRDRRNVEKLLSFISKDTETPFFGFMFFESPHARYYFPQDSVLRTDYLKELNYATMDVQRDMPLIFNRYVNSVHHLDQQLGRVLDSLTESGRLRNTLVVITGDHGEEFMENGRWGHNSAFHEQQIRVPLVVAGLDIDPAVIKTATSHLDIAPTVMGRLGVTSPATDYAVGVPLDQAAKRPYRLVASWNAMAYLGPEYKLSMPTDVGGLAEMSITDADDRPVPDEDAVLLKTRDNLVRVLKDMSRFYARE
ncbi:MAG: sulfatase-like hydrolase/transferase [Alloalcanivorax venustensis]|uniref:sulfatase-like hydrolase/transferase n=1 Tax=Alloalcanivorax venustensis TaxID=172371 RepID=UPI0032971D86